MGSSKRPAWLDRASTENHREEQKSERSPDTVLVVCSHYKDWAFTLNEMEALRASGAELASSDLYFDRITLANALRTE